MYIYLILIFGELIRILKMILMCEKVILRYWYNGWINIIGFLFEFLIYSEFNWIIDIDDKIWFFGVSWLEINLSGLLSK